ncbi:MAG: DNA replication/repair protein RecF [Alphaproteobacteria bacterium]|nr:DNA replication/repair protein RecF [Alphaproteobacteria bacterium]
MNTAFHIIDDKSKTKVRSFLKNLTLVNFRNYRYQRLNFNQPFVIFSGNNGSGKTNILEAISFLSQGRGLRNAKLSEVKTFDFLIDKIETPTFINNSGWAVSALLERDSEEYRIGTSVESSTKEIDFNESKEIDRRVVNINKQKLSSQTELNNYISMIWVTPQMDRLFQSGTQNRRSFLDRIVCSFDTSHARRLSSFDNVYRQWLLLLKEGNTNNNWLSSLEEQITEIGVAIACARKEQIDNLNIFMERYPDETFPEAFLALDGTIEKLLNDKPAIFVEDFYREALKKQRNISFLNDSTITINKTDLKVIYKRKNVPASFCSTGEQKSLLLSIIISQARRLTEYKGFPPIMLLDEIAAHLDEIRRDALLSKIYEINSQAFLTTTDEYDFNNIKQHAQFFEINNNSATEIFLK